MKDIYELANSPMGTTQVNAITPKVISETMEEIRRGKRVFAQFYRINRDLVNTGGTQVEFPNKNSGITIQSNMAPGNTINASSMSYSATTITITKHGVGLAIQGEAIRMTKRDVIRDEIIEAGEVYADVMDTLAIAAMFPKATFLAGGLSTLTAGAGTLMIGIVSTVGDCTGATIVNYAGGCSMAFGTPAAGAASIIVWYIPTTAGLCTVSATAVSFSAKDIQTGQANIQGYNFNPDVIVVHPRRYTELLYDPAVNFVQRSAYTGQGIPMNSEIGRLWDMRVIVTNKAPIYGVVLVDSTALGYCIERLDLSLIKDDVTGLSTDQLFFWGFTERTYGVVNPRAYGAIAWKGTVTTASSTFELQPSY